MVCLYYIVRTLFFIVNLNVEANQKLAFEADLREIFLVAFLYLNGEVSLQANIRNDKDLFRKEM